MLFIYQQNNDEKWDFKPHVTMASWLTPTEKAKAFQIPCGHPAEI